MKIIVCSVVFAALARRGVEATSYDGNDIRVTKKKYGKSVNAKEVCKSEFGANSNAVGIGELEWKKSWGGMGEEAVEVMKKVNGIAGDRATPYMVGNGSQNWLVAFGIMPYNSNRISASTSEGYLKRVTEAPLLCYAPDAPKPTTNYVEERKWFGTGISTDDVYISQDYCDTMTTTLHVCCARQFGPEAMPFDLRDYYTLRTKMSEVVPKNGFTTSELSGEKFLMTYDDINAVNDVSTDMQLAPPTSPRTFRTAGKGPTTDRNLRFMCLQPGFPRLENGLPDYASYTMSPTRMPVTLSPTKKPSNAPSLRPTGNPSEAPTLCGEDKWLYESGCQDPE